MSLINRMVDEACGYAPAQAKRAAAKAEAEETTAVVEGCEALVSWWKSRRPLRWRFSQHAVNPTVNCVDECEKRMALAAVELAKRGWA